MAASCMFFWEANLVQCCKAEDFDADLIGSQDGLFNLFIDTIGGKWQEILQNWMEHCVVS